VPHDDLGHYTRKGRYQVRKLIAKYGRKGNMMKWKEQINGDCPKRDAAQLARALRVALSRSAEGFMRLAQPPRANDLVGQISSTVGGYSDV